MEKNIVYYDVNDLEELPDLKEKNFRYLDFIGGSKEFRVFVVPIDMTRNDFIKKHSNLIDMRLFRPIYENKGIVITPDMSYALPGFYVLTYKSYVHHVDSLPDNLMMRTGILIKNLRKGLKQALNFECCNLYSDEKKRISSPLHYWFVPKCPEHLKAGLDHKLMDLNLNEYLKKFKYSKYKEQIIQCNEKMINYFKEINLKSIDDTIFNLASRSIILSITSKCNKKCLGCYNDFKNDDLKTEDWLRLIDFLSDNKIKKITIAGGDPLLRLDIFTILKYCIDKGFEVNMDTVGMVLLNDDESLIKKYGKSFSWNILKKLNYIGIPLDGSSSKIANKFRNESDDYFNNQIKVINKLVKKGCSISINTVLHKKNLKDIKNIYDVLKNKKIQKWQVFQFMGVGQIAAKNIEKFSINDEEFKCIKEELSKYAINSNFKINIKSEKSRYGNYIIIDSLGTAYIRESRSESRIDIDTILTEEGRQKILERYYFIC